MALWGKSKRQLKTGQIKMIQAGSNYFKIQKTQIVILAVLGLLAVEGSEDCFGRLSSRSGETSSEPGAIPCGCKNG